MGLGAINFDNINIGDVFRGFGDFLKDVRTVITGKDPTAMAALEAKALEMESAMMLAQASINLEEAKSKSLFVSGWRPAVGWIGAFGLGTQFIIFPLANWILPMIGRPDIKLPAVDISTLYPLLFALLGVGTLRTYEKTQGVQDKH